MRSSLRLLTAMLLCLGHLSLQALDTRTQIFDTSFRTLRVELQDDFYNIPVIRLNSNDVVAISFDRIADDIDYLQYRLIHCNADWQPSQLLDSEYLPGFNVANVTDYAFSSNTFIHFVNYRIELPNEDMTPLVSGNYLLQVFPEYEDENILLQARFCVSDNVVEISGEASTITDRGVNGEWQQLALELNLHNYTVTNPFTDIITTIEQNGDPNTLHTLLHPMRFSHNEIVYEHQPELIFPAGNEFRRFEMVQVQYPGMNVDSLRYMGRSYHAWLTKGAPRADKPYSYDQTQYGRFLIREYNATDSDLGADYVMTHFALKMPRLRNADIYLDGGLSYHLRSDYYRMSYDDFEQEYQLVIPLKQGSYNYRYLVLPRQEGSSVNANSIEGDFYETRNEYTIKVYHRELTARADKLIGTYLIH